MLGLGTDEEQAHDVTNEPQSVGGQVGLKGEITLTAAPDNPT